MKTWEISSGIVQHKLELNNLQREQLYNVYAQCVLPLDISLYTMQKNTC